MAAAHIDKELLEAVASENAKQEIPKNVDGVNTNYRENDVRFVQEQSQAWTSGFDCSTELKESKEEDIRLACKWIRECFDTNFKHMARPGGWRHYNPPMNLEKCKYDEKTDSIALLLLFGEQLTQEQVARSVDQAFFTNLKFNRPEDCKYTGLSLMHVRGFPIEVPSKIRCVVFKCWVHYRPRTKK